MENLPPITILYGFHVKIFIVRCFDAQQHNHWIHINFEFVHNWMTLLDVPRPTKTTTAHNFHAVDFRVFPLPPPFLLFPPISHIILLDNDFVSRSCPVWTSNNPMCAPLFQFFQLLDLTNLSKSGQRVDVNESNDIWFIILFASIGKLELWRVFHCVLEERTSDQLVDMLDAPHIISHATVIPFICALGIHVGSEFRFRSNLFTYFEFFFVRKHGSRVRIPNH